MSLNAKAGRCSHQAGSRLLYYPCRFDAPLDTYRAATYNPTSHGMQHSKRPPTVTGWLFLFTSSSHSGSRGALPHSQAWCSNTIDIERAEPTPDH